METKQIILEGKTALGVEFGSTRIKAVLIDEKGTPLASGSYEWENQYVDGIWTYDLDRVWKGLQECYQDLGFKKGDFPIAEVISATELSIPMYYGMTDEEVQYVIDKINEFR